MNAADDATERAAEAGETLPTRGPADRPPVPPELARGYVTADLPPVPGQVRVELDDFQVEEVPLYEACGEGEHLYLRVEKRGITTDEAIRRLARRLRVPRRAIGYAGLKDARARTAQTISAFGVRPAVLEAGLEALGDEQMRVLEAKRHKNKLKVGHLTGNRFRLRLTGAASGLEVARQGLARLAARGIPNYFGLQRFGRDRTTHLLGQALVREDAEGFVRLLVTGEVPGRPSAPVADGDDGDDGGPGSRLRTARAAAAAGDWEGAMSAFPRSYTPEHAVCWALYQGKSAAEAVQTVAFKQRVFYVSAFQSLLFNAYLTRRLDRIDRLEQGEVAVLHRNGAAFLVEDPEREAPRADALEISPSGPCFGTRLLRPAPGSNPEQDEQEVLESWAPGLGPELSDALGTKPLGQRRPLRVPLHEPHVEAEGDDLLLGFRLDRGCYATAVLEELFKRQTD